MVEIIEMSHWPLNWMTMFTAQSIWFGLKKGGLAWNQWLLSCLNFGGFCGLVDTFKDTALGIQIEGPCLTKTTLPL